MPNVDRYYDEMTDGDDYGHPDVDWETYIALSQNNQCVVVTMRDEGKLAGYAIYVIGNNLRHKSRIEAHSNGLFLEKEYRQKYSGEFIKKANEYLRKIGVHEASYVLSDDRVGRFLGRHGAKSNYKVWSFKYG